MLNREVLRQELISRRTFLISTGKVGVLSVLLARMAYLQLIKGSEYKILSDKNRITLVLSPPARGMILDRTGLPLVDNKKSFVLKLDRKQTSDYTKSLEEIFEILLPSEDAVRDVFSAIKRSNKKIPVTIFSDISWEEVSKIEERLHKFDGFYVESSSKRVYNFALSCAHLTGYIGKVSDADGFDQLEAASDIRVGKTGIEKFYEKTLQGEFGYKKVEVDAKGIFVNEIEKVESKPGENLKLNIDIVLQEALYNMLSEKGASATVVDLDSGGIVGFCSSPSFDPNLFINGVKQNYWKELRNSPYKPLINKLA